MEYMRVIWDIVMSHDISIGNFFVRQKRCTIYNQLTQIEKNIFKQRNDISIFLSNNYLSKY